MPSPVYYKPWRGRAFERTGILLLSESAYTWIDDGIERNPSRNHPSECVRCSIDRFDDRHFKLSRYFKLMTRALCRREAPSRSERMRAWNDVAYSIYVPRSVRERSGCAPR